jgi:hypothetical protein
MNRREITALVIGLSVGLLLGMILIGSSEDLRTSFFGSARDSDHDDDATPASVKDFEFYLVELQDTQEWIAEKYPETGEEFGKAVDIVARLSSTTDFRAAFRDAKEDVDMLLPQVYAALINADDIEQAKIEPDNNISVCLGLDDDPYGMSDPVLYLYLTIPTKQVKETGIPETWEKLDRPKDNDLYWQLLACYPEPKD